MGCIVPYLYPLYTTVMIIYIVMVKFYLIPVHQIFSPARMYNGRNIFKLSTLSFFLWSFKILFPYILVLFSCTI
jgi:hypothetical protein